MTDDLASRLLALGRRLGPDVLAGTIALLRDRHARPVEGDVDVSRDISYGPHARNLLDVFRPQGAGQGRPVLVFIHGGGFVQGERAIPGTPFHDNVARWAVRHGMVAINATYRLAPAVAWPSGVEDLRALFAWLVEHASAIGGDPRRVFFYGTSAGASHIANFLAHAPESVGLAGVILGSGVYEIVGREPAASTLAYYGAHAETYPTMSPADAAARSPVPMLVYATEGDPDEFRWQAEDFVARVERARGRAPTRLSLQGHNHYSPALSLGSDLPHDMLATELLSFVSATDRRSASARHAAIDSPVVR